METIKTAALKTINKFRKTGFIPIEKVNLNARMYRPKVNQKRRTGLLLIILLTGILPGPNFIGIAINKLTLKLNPLFLYQ